jgi:hypothetical protein
MRVHLLVLIAAMSVASPRVAAAVQPPSGGPFRELLLNEYNSQCRFLVAGNWVGLKATMSEDFVIIRENGSIVTRDAYITTLRRAYLSGLRFLNCRTALRNIT